MSLARASSKRNQVFGIFFAAVVVAGMCASIVRVHAISEDPINWLESQSFQVTKTKDLPSNQEPDTFGNGCASVKKDVNGDLWCRFATPMGYITNGVLEGPRGTASLRFTDGSGILPSVPGSNGQIMSARYVSNGSYWSFSRSTYEPSKLVYQTIFGYPPTNQYSYTITNPTTIALPKGLDASTYAYSSNGKWLGFYTSTDVPSSAQTIVLVNTTDFTAKTISVNSGTLFNRAGKRGVNLAISDDGKFVAVNGYIAGSPVKPTLRVYDVSTCLDQSSFVANYTTNLSNSCEYNDVWQGVFRTQSYSSSVPSTSGVEYPRHLRFNSDNSLSFQGVYGRTSSTTFSVAEYNVVPNARGAAPLSLLALGDSYISGEGAFTYRTGTDTSDNKCHQSWRSHPYLAGKSVFPGAEVKSVACSGATMNDVTEDNSTYLGQTRKKIPWSIRSDDLKNNVLSSTSPGYSNQISFVTYNQPRTTIISIGGNDIHFADIIKSCVSPFTYSQECYATYEDRKQLMQTIVDKYDSLVDTYKQIAQRSRGKVFVVGYPQIAKPGGNCGNNVLLRNEEVQFGADLITYLDSVIKRAASDAGVYYVDTEKALNGYRLCEAPKNKSAMNGLTLGNDSPVYAKIFNGTKTYYIGVGKESYHPTSFGHKLLSAAISTKTSNFTVVMPAKTNLGKPALDLNNALLQNRPHDSTLDIGSLSWNNPSDSNEIPVLFRGKNYKLNSELQTLQPGSTIRVVLHSTPTTLYDGDVDAMQKIQIPLDIEPGLHRLDISGVDKAGNTIDIREIVYVADSEDDFDGDGVINTESHCVIIPDAHVDEDQDGVDDACDGEIRNTTLYPDDPMEVPEEQPIENPDISSASNITPSDILVPYVEPAPLPDPETNSQDENSPSPPETQITAQEQSPLITIVYHSKKATFGNIEVLSNRGSDGTVLSAVTTLSKSEVNKERTVLSTPQGGDVWRFKYILLLLCGAILVSLLAIKRKQKSANI